MDWEDALYNKCGGHPIGSTLIVLACGRALALKSAGVNGLAIA